jgi:hypothetical protein
LIATCGPENPRFFELLYARIYRVTSEIVHYGIGAALARFAHDTEAEPAPDPGALSLNRTDEEGSAEMLGLALVTYGTLLSYSEPIIRHGLTEEILALVRDAHGMT